LKPIARCLRFLSFCLVLAAGGAHAQLLSNLANPVGGTYGPNPDSASIFVTGAASITINRVDVRMGTAGAGGNQVGIFTDNAGVPSTTQVGGFLTNPNPTTVGVMSYTGAPITLAANTTYWMVYKTVDGADVNWTGTPGAVASPATAGATMPPGSTFGNAATGVWINDGVNLLFALFGPAAAPQQVPTLSDWTLALLAVLMAATAIGFHRRREG